jgi:hypothetical protein
MSADQRNVFFNFEQVEAMHAAFVAACATLKLCVGVADRATELVALKIIDLALAGECDKDKLTALTLAEFGAENDGSSLRH